MASPLQSLHNQDSVSYLTQREAAEIAETLMGPLGFSVDQLMELAGLSVAVSIAEVIFYFCCIELPGNVLLRSRNILISSF
ncbi:hypothetical protein SLEP1_g20941 [Rubroshorea leprosula]|uniref:Uncharacterized protein n=1 Tax=Rubroshorea leprosula TaxID=152421 RepID=A0AAV5JDL0_9ROSI|nr:hypothetical protein SLEP1_g20941 [Rubroshorea leprosula]